jgi:hypothetical protein
MVWEFEHSVECRVSRDFAWRFWTDVSNWMLDTSLESVTFDGPFAAGAKGVNKPRGGDPIEWRIVEVQDRSGAVIEIALPGANVKFNWRFEDTVDGGVRMTQRVTLEGERAEDYVEGMKQLEWGIPQGMQKMAEVMVAREQA